MNNIFTGQRASSFTKHTGSWETLLILHLFPVSSLPRPTKPAGHPKGPQGAHRFLPAVVAFSTESAHHPGWLSAASGAVPMSPGAFQPAPEQEKEKEEKCTQGKWAGAEWQGKGKEHREEEGLEERMVILTTRYCCSVWASRCSQPSNDAFFCCKVGSRVMRSWAFSWDSWVSWAGKG